MRNALIIEEFTRLGGGQIAFYGIYNSLRSTYGSNINILTSKIRPFLKNVDSRLMEVDYVYREGINPVSMMSTIWRVKRQMNRIIDRTLYDFVLNNHPTTFLYSGNINYLHAVSIVDNLIDHYGNVVNPVLFNLVTKLGIYRIYDGSVIVVPSSYSREIAIKIFHKMNIYPKRVDVMNPPVDIPEYVSNIKSRKKRVLYIGRINKEKGVENVLEIASAKKNTEFIVAGAVNAGDDQYYESLKRVAPPNVTFYANISEETKAKLMTESSVQLHIRKKEAFPLSVIEGMSCGCVPVVPKFGGSWKDIINEGEFGLGFGSNEEAVQMIDEALELSESERNNIINRGKSFSTDQFRRRFLNYITETDLTL